MREALKKHLDSQPTSLIFFYMPDCNSCLMVKPKVLAFAKKRKIALFQIPTTSPDWVDLAKIFNVQDFPTLYYVEGSKVKHEYLGADEITELIQLEGGE
jgi:thiol-disulfide isomerase/thioredoxin